MTSTAIVLFFLPWGPFTFVTVLYLVAYMPIAAILLATIWRRDVIGPIETSSVAHTVSTLATIRVCASAVGIALVGVALVAGAGPLGYVPSAPFLLVAVWPGAAEGFDEGIEEAKARPLGALVLLNGLNVLDAILSDAAIGAGTASELNPFVLAVGTPVKLALVAACSALLYWKRPPSSGVAVDRVRRARGLPPDRPAGRTVARLSAVTPRQERRRSGDFVSGSPGWPRTGARGRSPATAPA